MSGDERSPILGKRSVLASTVPSVLLGQIELRHLRYVIAVSEDLHFGQAADRLHLAAPSLSKQIRQLEEHLGYRLFERRTRQVLLTKAGVAFVREAREALNHVGLALSLSAAANHSKSGVVFTGYFPWADLPWIMAARDRLHHEMATNMVLRSEHTPSLLDSLLAGRLDAGIVILPIKATELTVHVLRRERLLLALEEGHPLAASETIALKSLADAPFISMDASLKRTLNEYLQDVCEGSGFSPNVVQEVTSISEALELVASKIGSALIRASSVARLQAKGVVFRECAEPGLFVEVGLAYRTLSPPPGVETFISLLRQA